MRLDFRILIPVLLPFVFLGVARALWFCAGADWSTPGEVAAISMILGITFGVTVSGVLFAGGISLGHLQLWGKFTK